MLNFNSLTKLPVIRAREQIPAPKRRRQWLHTLLGLGIAGGAFALPNLMGVPWPAAYAVAFIGGWIASKQLMLDLMKALPQAIAAIVNALTGKAPADPPPPSQNP